MTQPTKFKMIRNCNVYDQNAFFLSTLHVSVSKKPLQRFSRKSTNIQNCRDRKCNDETPLADSACFSFVCLSIHFDEVVVRLSSG